MKLDLLEDRTSLTEPGPLVSDEVGVDIRERLESEEVLQESSVSSSSNITPVSSISSTSRVVHTSATRSNPRTAMHHAEITMDFSAYQLYKK